MAGVELSMESAQSSLDEQVKDQQASSENVMKVFTSFQKMFNTEQDIRENIRTAVRELEQTARGIYTAMQRIHHTKANDVPAFSKKIHGMFDAVKPLFDSLKEVVPQNDYYRYSDHWRFVIQRLSFLASLLVYLESDHLATRVDVAQLLGVCAKQEEGFHLDLDDFLMGLLTMCNELSRLAVNSVILGDYHRPFAISTFLSEVSVGFRLLNLKNDGLRKKFDSLKYDLKKVEEVVYDITIRGLKPGDVEN